MADNRIVISNFSTCEDIDSFSQVFCLPQRLDCSPGCRDQLLVACASTYACTRGQGEAPFNIPYVEGDKIMFQTQFIDDFNGDPESPATGWGLSGAAFMVAELYDQDGTLVSGDVSTFASRYLVGWDGTQSYQIVEIDTSLIASDCWSLKLRAFNSSFVETDSLCSQDFSPVLSCIDTVVVQSDFTKYDCCGDWYGDPVEYAGTGSFKFDNSLRYYARVKNTGGAFEKQSFQAKSRRFNTKVKVTDPYKLILLKTIPEFLKNRMYKVHLAGEEVYIDDALYNIDSLNVENQAGCMWYFDINLSQECEVKYKC